MDAQPMTFPLNAEGKIYALQDEKGNIIGTGTREICEVLVHIMTKGASRKTHEESHLDKTMYERQ